MSAFVPPWAHDGGTEKMIARLKDPATRARIVKDIKTPSDTWDNEWDEVAGPESILIGVVKNPALHSLQGQTIAAIAKARGKDPIVLKRGMWADVVVFDPATIADRSTFSSPNELASGMQWVLVNGVAVIADGKMTGAKPGKVLRGPGYKPLPAS
jgi:N-acyl-D-aspartate/D-glutamate deacylase